MVIKLLAGRYSVAIGTVLISWGLNKSLTQVPSLTSCVDTYTPWKPALLDFRLSYNEAALSHMSILVLQGLP